MKDYEEREVSFLGGIAGSAFLCAVLSGGITVSHYDDWLGKLCGIAAVYFIWSGIRHSLELRKRLKEINES